MYFIKLFLNKGIKKSIKFLIIIILFGIVGIWFYYISIFVKPYHLMNVNDDNKLHVESNNVNNNVNNKNRNEILMKKFIDNNINKNFTKIKNQNLFSENNNENENSKLFAVTYASHGGRDDRFCRSVESAIRNNINLIILGWGIKWRGLSQKLEAAHDFTSNLNNNDIILFTDAYDVLFTDEPHIIKQKYLEFNSSIVFSAECGCWPHIMDGRICFDKYPMSPTPYRYLNSGAWIGRAKQAQNMLNYVMIQAGANFANANDQKLMGDIYIEGKYDIKLDFYSKIFQSMHMTLDKPLPYCDPTKHIKLNKHNNFINTLTNTKPAIYHFNGGGKRVHLSMEKSIWYKKNSLYNTKIIIDDLKKHLISVPLKNDKNRKISFNDLCPNYLSNRA